MKCREKQIWKLEAAIPDLWDKVNQKLPSNTQLTINDSHKNHTQKKKHIYIPYVYIHLPIHKKKIAFWIYFATPLLDVQDSMF